MIKHIKTLWILCLTGVYFGLASQGLYQVLGAYGISSLVLQTVFLLVLHTLIAINHGYWTIVISPIIKKEYRDNTNDDTR